MIWHKKKSSREFSRHTRLQLQSMLFLYLYFEQPGRRCGRTRSRRSSSPCLTNTGKPHWTSMCLTSLDEVPPWRSFSPSQHPRAREAKQRRSPQSNHWDRVKHHTKAITQISKISRDRVRSSAHTLHGHGAWCYGCGSHLRADVQVFENRALDTTSDLWSAESKREQLIILFPWLMVLESPNM